MTSSPRPGSSSGMHSLERSARGLSSRILRNRDVHETWVEDLEQISRDVDQLFSEDTQGGRKNRTQTWRNGSGSGSSQGSISASVPVTSSSPLQSYQSHRHRTSISAAGPSHQRVSKHVRRRSSLDLHSRSQGMSSPEAAESRDPEHSERHDDLAGVPHLRYDIQDRERFIAHPPRALTQYVVAEGNLRHGHEEVNGTIHHRPHHSEKHRNSDEGKRGKIVREQDSRNHRASEPRDDDDNDDDGEETIRLPSTLGLRSSGTYSTLRGSRRSPSRSRSRSPEHIQSRPGPSVLTAPAPRIIVDSTSSPSSSSHQPTRAPNAYNMLSSFVYPTSTSSIPARSNSTSSTSRTKGKNSPFGSPWGSIRGPATMAEKPAFESNSPRHGGSGFTRRRHSTSPAASVLSTKTSRSGGSGSSTVTSGSGSRSRSQTPKPLETGFTFPPAVGRRCMTPPLEGSGESRSSLEGSGHSSDSFPTKQTILSLRKILDTHNPPAKPPSDDWTLISKPPRLLQQPLKTGLPAEAGTSTATASISKLFTRGVHSHEGSVTRIRTDEQKYSSFKGKGKSSANNTSVPPTPTTPTPVSTPALNNKMNFSMSFPEFLSTGVALALGGPSPLSSKPSSGTSTPATPGHSKRISFAELPEGTQGTGPERRSKKRKGKQRASSRRSGNDSLKGSRKSGKRHSGSDEDGDEPKGWLGWLIGVSGVDSGRSDKIDERLGKSWGNLNSASRGPGYGGGLDEWGM
ncbi:hypothetical protein BT96DRAFT_468297 [Gymnopus androsaceus JB14]|uniref:Uncharacterized protein n=1 Tax=Gymnopus androsaceus JB14 TaxID=1447944 RepID=A0A6A4IMQ9_9AGAR|nr:hypothetical protein BT96DRAFT_468297 [Gymnopus androsaceus JB14]